MQEFHPVLYRQHREAPHVQHPSFNAACDHFFSGVEAQKIELKSVQQERGAVKKLENVKRDHETRIRALVELQDLDRHKGELIEMNSDLVNSAIKVILSAIANQIPWDQIREIIREATESGDPVAGRIKQVRLETNHMVMQLSDPYAHLDLDGQEGEEAGRRGGGDQQVDIDLGLTAQANARKYFVQKKTAAVKERKTVESGGLALKSAEKKTKQALKEMAKISNIIKARKVYWFEKFFWFISTENYLVIGGRDAQQNELLVKRYMKAGDVYVHADLHGAATVVVKNPDPTAPVPPKSLHEAGQFAVCFSAAWDSKVLTSAYWVTPDQVSKTAPSGEYLTVGSFMVRGKKNFLPPSQLTMGFGFLFRLEDDSVERHKDDRRVRGLEGGAEEVMEVAEALEEVEIDVEAGESSEEEEVTKQPMEEIKEETEEVEEQPTDVEEVEEQPTDDVVEDADDDANVKEKVLNESDEEGSCSGDDDDTSKQQTCVEENATEASKKEDVVEFPDTDVKVGYDRLGSVEIKTRTVSTSEDVPPDASKKVNKKQKVQRLEKSQKGQKNEEPKAKSGRAAPAWKAEEDAKKSEQVRGKKGKLKKMKEKYKDQDDEERELRMQLLQSQGNQDDEAKSRKKKKEARGLEKLYGKGGHNKQKVAAVVRQPRPAAEPGVEEEPREERPVDTELGMLAGLTGLPVTEDELLFAVPVVAPYATMLHYKYKVKLTPGTGKRGKSCKTALAMFLADRGTLPREKDLLKSVKDQDLARNLPGKVKLSAPHLQRVKGKK